MKLNKLTYKKAAMFGLDARIALAIFGALSVISGAALYSVIQEAKVAKFVTEALEIGKAWEQYYLDTGVPLTNSASSPTDPYFYARKVEYLINDPGIDGWSGPYLNRTLIKIKVTNPYLLSHDMAKILSSGLSYYRDPSSSGFNNVYCVSGTTDCALWIQHGTTYGALPTSFYDRLDEYIDGSDGRTAGNFRYSHNSTLTYTNFFIKYVSVKNPVDNP